MVVRTCWLEYQLFNYLQRRAMKVVQGKAGTGSAVLSSKLWDAAAFVDMKYRVRSGMLEATEKRSLGTWTYVLPLSYFSMVLEQMKNEA